MATHFSSRHSISLKLILIGLLMLLLAIPLTMISSLVSEREYRRTEVTNEVNSLWGYAQTITGPILSIPYRTVWIDTENKSHVQIQRTLFLPDELNVTSTLVPEIRWRGIYKVVVYQVHLKITGHFSHPNLTSWKISPDNILWEDSTLSMGLSDTRGIQDTLFLNWDDSKEEFLSGVGDNQLIRSGLHVRLANLANQTNALHKFSMEITLNGNGQLSFIPVGKKTVVTLSSGWPDPSFMGAFLPAQRDINANGFNATWKVSHLGRSYPQSWTTEELTDVDLNSSEFGVRLLLPVDFYQKSERSIKYGILFIVLTFTAFFLFEVLSSVRLHPLQYLMVGFALCLFYLLLLSISEHLGFIIAYLIASGGTIGLITRYTASILHSKQRAGILGLMLAGLYAYLYFLLHLQDYALLFGSIGLFIILAVIMFITRNIDWYAVNLHGTKQD